MTTRRAVGALAAALVLALGAAPSAWAAAGMEIAVQDDAHFLSDAAGERERADTAAAIDAVSVRANVGWASTAPSPTARRAPASPRYDFSRYDRLVADAAARGLRVQLTLTGPAPAWASAAHRVGGTALDAGRFGAFAAQAAAHFRGRVDRWSIWNEPNWYSRLNPERICRGRRCTVTAARAYRALYRAAWTAIRRADPGADVWIGETAPYDLRSSHRGHRTVSTAPLRFLRELTCRDGIVRGCRGRLPADGYAHHPYQFEHAPGWRDPKPDRVTIGTLGRLRAALARLARAGALRHAGGGRMPIYLTEFAYFSSGPRALEPARRARYTAQAFERALAAPDVRQLTYYQLFDPPPGTSWRSGLIDAAGRPHPAFDALRDFVARNLGRLARPRR